MPDVIRRLATLPVALAIAALLLGGLTYIADQHGMEQGTVLLLKMSCIILAVSSVVMSVKKFFGR